MNIDTVYHDYASLVSRLTRRMIRNGETARDAAQEAWVEIVRALPSFEGRSAPSTWVWSIARRSIFRYAMREKTWSTRFLREFFSAHSDDGLWDMDRIPCEDRQAWVRINCSDCLSAILHCVDNETRFVYLLREMARADYAEIAKITDRDEAAVRQTCLRARKKIRGFLSGECAIYNPSGTCRCKMKQPISIVDPNFLAEQERVRSLYRKLCFLDRADAWYGNQVDYWKDLYEREGKK